MVSPAIPSGLAAPASPARARHVTARVVDGELVLYDAKRQRVHVLNPTAAFVWSLCDGKHDEATIIASLAERYPDSRQAIEEDVPGILELVRSEGLLEW